MDQSTLSELNFSNLMAAKNRRLVRAATQIGNKYEGEDEEGYRKELEQRLQDLQMQDESTFDAGITKLEGNQSALQCDDGELFASKMTPDNFIKGRKLLRQKKETNPELFKYTKPATPQKELLLISAQTSQASPIKADLLSMSEKQQKRGPTF